VLGFKERSAALGFYSLDEDIALFDGSSVSFVRRFVSGFSDTPCSFVFVVRWIAVDRAKVGLLVGRRRNPFLLG